MNIWTERGRINLTFLAMGLLLVLMASCTPAGCYGPKAFGYNTQGVAVSNLFGIYRFDGTNASILNQNGFTNHAGYIELRSDMTCVLSNVPRMWLNPAASVYVSGTWKWKPMKPVHEGGAWELEILAPSSDGLGPDNLSFPILNESPPHGIEIDINHNLGY
jgi:hypothetical protein